MVGWQRHLRNVFTQIGKRVEHNYNVSANFSCSRLESSSLVGELPYLQRLWKLPSATIPRPYYYYFQQLGISSSRQLLADSDVTPVASPLTPALALTHTQVSRQLLADSDVTPVASPLTPALALNGGKTEDQKVVSKPSKVLKGIKQSPKKVNLVAELVRGMRVEDALLQLQLTVKRASKTVYQVIHSARANATHNHGLDADRLLVAEAFVGKGFFKKRVSYHAKGKCGIKVRPECRLTVVVREMTPEEEAKLAKLRVSNFRKLSKRERRLVPHQLIETTSIWNRKANGGVASDMAS